MVNYNEAGRVRIIIGELRKAGEIQSIRSKLISLSVQDDLIYSNSEYKVYEKT